ncbi:TetR/AcrR family transcriptional regulator [Phytomonospora endophytica]|uniref:AcrR family transcriptional regulator n=1 Tax=Phytomonospora endophytica TaxID=714109 RepID=A0A841F9T0_9ACTN|nr:helix-turn-helix domain-containing protein [Phytomonospora endophytica]MBB6033971.1 AcrR family transcriptional regulator [Phytomonospora endophytica]GIG64508.1 TetR family transcriptional regulator [Phytomonospora endophytica]
MSEEVIWLRPEHAAVGRPAERSRAEITAAAIGLADREGLDAVSMRKVAAELGTGAASLYRYVANRDDLLDLMADATAAEYELRPPSGDPLADLGVLGTRSLAIMRRHPWLPTLVLTRSTLGPGGADLLEHFLTVVDGLPLDATAKMEGFALLQGFIAMYAHHEAGAEGELMRRQTAYLAHVAGDGGHPRLAAVFAEAGDTGADRFPGLLRRVLTGLLGDIGA